MNSKNIPLIIFFIRISLPVIGKWEEDPLPGYSEKLRRRAVQNIITHGEMVSHRKNLTELKNPLSLNTLKPREEESTTTTTAAAGPTTPSTLLISPLGSNKTDENQLHDILSEEQLLPIYSAKNDLLIEGETPISALLPPLFQLCKDQAEDNFYTRVICWAFFVLYSMIIASLVLHQLCSIYWLKHCYGQQPNNINNEGKRADRTGLSGMLRS